MLSIDEEIAHEKEVAKVIYVEAMLCHANPDDGKLDDCIERGKYHEQLAEWLEELKDMRNLDKTNFSNGYNRGIDDFLKEADATFLMQSDGTAVLRRLENIADRLKGGIYSE